MRDKFPDNVIRSAIGLTTTQFRQKLAEAAAKEQPTTVDFCQVETSLSKPQMKKPPLREAPFIPANHTIIVEFYREDGRLMKIHTTTDSFAELLKTFYQGE